MTYAEAIESLRNCFGFGTCSECKAKNMMEEDPLPCKLDCKDRLGLYAADLIKQLAVKNTTLENQLFYARAERDVVTKRMIELEIEKAKFVKECKQ